MRFRPRGGKRKSTEYGGYLEVHALLQFSMRIHFPYLGFNVVQQTVIKVVFWDEALIVGQHIQYSTRSQLWHLKKEKKKAHF